MRFTILLLTAFLLLPTQSRAANLKDLGPTTRPGDIEIRGLAAGRFDSALWQSGKRHFVADARTPLIAPKPGPFRNIYAPSIVPLPDGSWRIFYGGWDGQPTGNDRIYCVDADSDFTHFGERHKIIEHGAFQHVCNVSAQRLDDGAFNLICTGYPDQHGLNKPVFFSSNRSATKWNNSPPPYEAKLSDIVSIAGYAKYPNVDINGMNVLLLEGQTRHLYFSSFTDFGVTYRATSTDGKHYTLDGPVFHGQYAVNDVKRLHGEDGTSWYLMGLHMNRAGLWYSLSRDPMNFPAAKLLASPLGKEDHFIVAIGFVVSQKGDRVLGFLYGAGANPNLAQNRIFARWLQKSVAMDALKNCPVEAIGPDRAIIHVGEDHPTQSGAVRVLSEDGQTELARIDRATLKSSHGYQLKLP